MSESDNQTEEPRKSSKGLLLLLLLLALAVGGMLVYKKTQHKHMGSEDITTAATSQNTDSEESAAEDEAQDAQAEDVDVAFENEEVEGIDPDARPVSEDFDLEKAATPRILGDANAPVKISEFSSFTCPHCATFHANNFKEIKKEFIDTGKAYIVFDDFARNGIDISIGALARCLPEQSYFNYIQLMFETQEEWMKNINSFKGYARQNAIMAGITPQMADYCFDNMELKEKMAMRVQKAQQEHGITGTPTIVINDKQVMSGLSPYASIKKAIEDALAENAE